MTSFIDDFENMLQSLYVVDSKAMRSVKRYACYAKTVIIHGIYGIPLIFPLYFRVIMLVWKSNLFPCNYVGLEFRKSGITRKTE